MMAENPSLINFALGNTPMLPLLLSGQVLLFGIILVAIILSLSLHEFGHARAASWLGDRTAAQQGRLTINPMAHIDPVGLLMVVFVGFGYAKPVPFNPRNVKQKWGGAAIAAAGPLMNLLIAIVAVNTLSWGLHSGEIKLNEAQVMALSILANINLLLMFFNLIPLGPLDGHYIMSWFLPTKAKYQYDQFNARFGTHLFLGLIVLSLFGVPVFRFLMSFSASLVPYITFI